MSAQFPDDIIRHGILPIAGYDVLRAFALSCRAYAGLCKTILHARALEFIEWRAERDNIYQCLPNGARHGISNEIGKKGIILYLFGERVLYVRYGRGDSLYIKVKFKDQILYLYGMRGELNEIHSVHSTDDLCELSITTNEQLFLAPKHLSNLPELIKFSEFVLNYKNLIERVGVKIIVKSRLGERLFKIYEGGKLQIDNDFSQNHSAMEIYKKWQDFVRNTS